MGTRQNLWGGSGSAWQRASRSERFSCALYTVATPERSDGCKHHHNRRADTDTSHRATSKWCFLELAERGNRTSCCSALARLSPKLTDPSWSSSGREPWSSKAWGQTHTHTHTHVYIDTQCEGLKAGALNIHGRGGRFISVFVFVNTAVWDFYTWLHNKFPFSANKTREVKLSRAASNQNEKHTDFSSLTCSYLQTLYISLLE